MSKTKKTAYFYAAIIILVLMLGMFIFEIADYNTQIDMYVASYGYDEAYVKEMIPFWATLLPEFSNHFTSYGLMALIAFGINCILNALRNDDYILDDLEIEALFDADGDGKNVFEEIKEDAKEALDKAEDKIVDIAEKLDDAVEDMADKAEEFFNKED